MRHLLALAAVLALAGACLAAEFKSDEAKKAQADYLAALDAAKTAYGQGLAKAKATIAAKAAAATDAISREAIQSESAAITEELVRLRDANAAAFEPREWKSAETKKVKAAYAAELKAAQIKYGQDLTKARYAVLARKTAATDLAAKDALQAEIVLIEEERVGLKDESKGEKKEVKKEVGKGVWIDLLPLLDLTRDVVKGKWESTKSGLAGDTGLSGLAGMAQIEMPMVPSGNYELEVRFVRISGNEFTVFLPAGSKSVALFMGGRAGRVSGLEQINGKGYSLNETTVEHANLEYGKTYTANMRVIADETEAEIVVTMDGKPHIKWSGSQQALSPPSWFALRKTSYLGFTLSAKAVIQSARLRMLSGKALPKESPEASKGAKP